jgi:uncharacterized protein with HEPN domain
MSKRDSILLLEDIVTSAQKIKRYTGGLDYEAFISDERTVDAVVRNFEIIGEAANRLNKEFREQHPEIEWNRIRGFRNRIVHEYFGIDYRIVWTIIETYLDDLISNMETVVDGYKDGGTTG